jgi:Holliday junction resolvase RusA-like endonuclease
MYTVNIKPLSVNEAWQGRRYKTPAYKRYAQELNILLPKIKLPEPPFTVIYHVFYSSKASDIDNFLKAFNDCLQKKYNFNDNLIYHSRQTKHIVSKGSEKIQFSIKPFVPDENQQIAVLLNEGISYAEEAIDEIESKETTTSNDDRRLKLAEQFIAKCEKQIKELNAF